MKNLIISSLLFLVFAVITNYCFASSDCVEGLWILKDGQWVSSREALGNQSFIMRFRTGEENRCVVTIDNELYNTIKEVSKKYELMDDPKSLTLDLPPMNIIVDRQGRVFSDTATSTATIKWGSKTALLEVSAPVDVYRNPEPDLGFRIRYKASTWGIASLFDKNKPQKAIDAGISLEAFHWKDFNFSLVAGIKSFGVSAGMDVTKNFGIFVGGGSEYMLQLEPTAFAGIYFSFN